MEVVIVIVFGALVIGIAVYQYYANKARQAALAALAADRGWTFDPARDHQMDARYLAFRCLRQGDNRYAYNLLEGSSGGRSLHGFDYHYETHSTDSKGNRQTHDHYFSAVVVEVSMSLHQLLIRPENFLDKLGEFFGFDDIDFESDEFSRKFCVKARDRRWAFDVIHQGTMEFLLAAPRFSIEFAGHHVIAYRSSTFEPNEFPQAVEVISGILDRIPADVTRDLCH